MVLRLALALIVWFAALGPAAAALELQTPDGRTVVLYDDFTWEYERPAPAPAADTVTADALVGEPSKFKGQQVVVSGSVAKLLGEYRLQSGSEQKAMTVDLSKIRRADQIALEKALKTAGTFGSVKVQIHGQVEQDVVTYKLVASELLVL
jgi:hypothetical protein